MTQWIYINIYSQENILLDAITDLFLVLLQRPGR